MRRRVIFGRRAQADLDEIYDWIAEQAGERTAARYVARLRQPCERLDLFPERGAQRDDLAPGLRVFGFERRVSIAFKVYADRVVIVRVFYGGRDLNAAFAEPGDLD